ncbi:uncharacterized protein LOC126557524 [Anopheles maculipalpis]|uniref:uncharacterized protein LOC126557524 n=1 Tax=Anopheles maculipalpis TaxID=1496333 RepID=UPI002159A5E9|nr:uncharacterized protein LOC126557524 [Anopheles maculipalpis]
MSLQVSNQTTSGRRTPQVYPGFGALPAGATATTPTATNGSGTASGPNTAGSGSVGRAGKGNSKQSHIPVAIGSVVGTPNITETTPAAAAAPQTAVVHPGTAGTTDGTPGQKSLQSDHVYGMKQQSTAAAATMIPAAAANRSTTNGTQSATADKSRVSQQKSSAEVAVTGKKAEQPAAPPQLAVTGETGSKLRAPTNSRNAQQKQSAADEGVAAAKASVQQPKTEKAAVTDNSLLTEKSLRGFMSDGEEMESLLLDPWDLEDTQPLARTNAGKSKAAQKAVPQAQARVSPFKTGKQQDNATVEKEATNSSSPSKKGAAPPEVEADKNRSPKASVASKGGESTAPSTPVSSGNDSLIGRPLRSISGRRSTRPIADIKFTHHRRSIADPHNDSISSMNVTIGSEVGNDSLLMRTPAPASRKRKDMTPESTSDIAVAESPKRARFDLSGIFSKVVGTPVSMLKDRLFRVNLQSTPRALIVDEEDASKVVTAEATTTTANITPQKDGEGGAADKPAEGQTTAAKMEIDVAEKEDKSVAESGQTVVSGKDDTEKQQQQGQESSSATVADEDEVEVKIVTTGQQQPKRCSIM